tara:strand:- start:742 stop:1974 length:1233 start_codon:yes stop_codon:yes gene_type:complete
MFLLINKFFFPRILCILIALLPVALLSGSLIINSFHIIICLIFFIELIKERKINFLNNEFFYLLLFLWFSFIINLIFSTVPEATLPRALGFVRFIFLVFAIKYIFNLQKENYSKIILIAWFITFLIVTLDLVFEYFFGKNILGFESYMPGRLAGFLNDELKIGGYYLGFALISIGSISLLIKNENFIFPLIFIAIFLIVSFLIGERSNFIKLFIMFFLFSLFIFNNKLPAIVAIFSCVILIFFGLIITNEKLKYRYLNQINYSKINQTLYYQHYKSAINIFKDNPYFGVGIKNFRNEIIKDEYKDRVDYEKGTSEYRHIISTHPHQLNFEILSETGIFGFICYLFVFILSFSKALKSYLRNKNILLLSSFLFCLIYLNPILPSGSFFTTYSATIFWINFALMITFIKNTK